MKLRAPSVGFCYLVLTLAAVPWFFDYINQPVFFEQPWGSRERDVGEAHYLLDIARDCTTNQREKWLRRALELFLKTSELGMADQVIAELEHDGVSAEGAGLLELVPGAVWAFGLDSEGWTAGTQPATFILRNPTAQAQQVEIHLTTNGDGRARYVTRGEPVWFSLVGDGAQKSGSVTSPVVAPGSSMTISVGASKAVMNGGKQRGLKFERVELVR